MQKRRESGSMAHFPERSTITVLSALSTNGATGPSDNPFFKVAFSHAKIASEFSMRHFHVATAPT